MNINQLVQNEKRNFNITICLIGVIPFLIFVYLLGSKVSTFKVFAGEIGCIMFFAILIFILGIATGRRMLMSLISQLFEKDRLAAITETTLTLGDEINNPLLVIQGNFELIEEEAQSLNLPQKIRDRLTVIKGNFEKITEVTDKLSSLSRAATKTVFGNTRMIDLDKSK